MGCTPHREACSQPSRTPVTASPDHHWQVGIATPVLHTLCPLAIKSLVTRGFAPRTSFPLTTAAATDPSPATAPSLSELGARVLFRFLLVLLGLGSRVLGLVSCGVPYGFCLLWSTLVVVSGWCSVFCDFGWTLLAASGGIRTRLRCISRRLRTGVYICSSCQFSPLAIGR
ncbi:hypothetical protein C2E23DRAFT_849002 [Lenzites betulinus]|nr:hypothetical protein C2E23DRAFT_849002 [Lenzites betulinus]